ncbi:MAG: GNAT family N-acetyltransferase [Actinobacteria bacterium]|nr:GNAT family N-acetyltransferase [Actinomycetota bacterium]
MQGTASDDVVIRTVRSDEWPQWRDVRLRMLRDDAAFFSSRYDDAVREPDESWRTWVTEAAAGTAKTLLCADDGSPGWLGVVGGFVRVDPTQAQLISMWVAPEARGRGVAQALIRELAGWAVSRGCETIFLFVQEANAPARALYERVGFVATGDRAPVSGRRGFKLVLSAPAAQLASQ